MKTRLCLLTLLAGWAATGCQTPMKVKTTYDHRVVFADLHTYCWVAPPAWLANDPRLRMDVVGPAARQEVEAQMTARGFQSNDCATADFQVTCSGGIQEGYTEKPTGQGEGVSIYTYSPETGGQLFTSSSGMAVDMKRMPYLSVEIREPKSGRVLWKGTGASDLPRPANDAVRVQRVQKAIQLILKNFPPPPAK